MNAARKRTHLPARDTATTVAAATPTRHDELSQRIAALSGLTAQQLRDEWRRLYRGQPPRLSRDLLIRSIAYRMQELAHGGLEQSDAAHTRDDDQGIEGQRERHDRARPARQVGCTPRARMAWQNPHRHRD